MHRNSKYIFLIIKPEVYKVGNAHDVHMHVIKTKSWYHFNNKKKHFLINAMTYSHLEEIIIIRNW